MSDAITYLVDQPGTPYSVHLETPLQRDIQNGITDAENAVAEDVQNTPSPVWVPIEGDTNGGGGPDVSLLPY